MAKDYKAEYAAKLRDPRWQKMRLEIMNRDGFRCQICFDTEKTLNVHHCKYKRGLQPWEYPPQSLVTLCEKCHKLEPEEYADSLKYFIAEVENRFFTSNQFEMITELILLLDERAVHKEVGLIIDLFNSPKLMKYVKDKIEKQNQELTFKGFV